MFPSKHLPKSYIFKHSTKDTIKRENILPLLPNSLNLLLVSLWGRLMSSWTSSASAFTSSWSSFFGLYFYLLLISIRPRFTRYTPLTAERSRVLEEALNADLLKAPSRTPTPHSADLTKQCRYHRNLGHTTEDCWALKDKIEELIQAGHLRRFVQTSREDGKNEIDIGKRQGRRDTQTNERRGRGGREGREGRGGRDRRGTIPVRGVINMIVGGFAGGGTTSSSWKRHLRAVNSVYSISRSNRTDLPPMLFTNSDFRNINPRQDDPMVVTIEVANFVIMETLIDQGSYVDIL